MIQFNANFDIKGKFIDFETTDGAVSGIFPCKSGKNVILYPCSVCSKEVTDKMTNQDVVCIVVGVKTISIIAAMSTLLVQSYINILRIHPLLLKLFVVIAIDLCKILERDST